MTIPGIGAVGTSGVATYAALSPYLNGVVRPSDAQASATAAVTETAGAVRSATATATATVTTTMTVTPAAPFANPAIDAIALAAQLTGDGGHLVQEYGAVALLTGPIAVGPVYQSPAPIAIAPIKRVLALPPPTKAA